MPRMSCDRLLGLLLMTALIGYQREAGANAPPKARTEFFRGSKAGTSAKSSASSSAGARRASSLWGARRMNRNGDRTKTRSR